MLGFEYTIALDNIDMAVADVPGTICRITAGAAVPVVVSHIELGTRTPTTPEGTGVRIYRASTAGTGGAANTPNPASASSPAAACSVVDAQTAFSVQPTTGVLLPGFDYDALGQFSWRVDPRSGIIIPASGILVVNIEVDPGATRNWSGFITIHEIR